MAFLNNIDEIRSIEWGKKHLWDVRFEAQEGELVEPFNRWFPAIDIDDEVANLTSYQFEAFTRSYKLPQRTQSQSVRLTFTDTAAHDLFEFFNVWINETIFASEGTTHYVRTLTESVRLLQIARLNAQREEIGGLTRSLWVYPEGPLVFNGSSSSDPNNYTIELVIAGASPSSN